MNPRYVVDCRVGMVSVMDTLSPNYKDGDCRAESSATVKTWHGKQYKHPKAPCWAIWYVPYLCEKAAKTLCAKLNAVHPGKFNSQGE